MGTLDMTVTALPGIGPKKAAAFEKLGIRTLRDMLNTFPRRYDDRSVMKPIATLVPGESCCIRAMVATQPRLNRVRRGMELVKFQAADDSGAVEITYFNQP